MTWSDWVPASLARTAIQPPRDSYGIYQFATKDLYGKMEIVYIGRARTGATTLFDRIRRHLQSYGSNAIFTLSQDANVQLFVRWNVACIGQDAAQMESAELQKFIDSHGRLPSCNRKNERNQRLSDSLLARFRLSAQSAELGVMGAFCLLTGIIASGFTILFRSAWT